jgi:hypothetical protein
MSMSRIKAVVTVLALAVIVSLTSSANAAAVKVVIAGSSAMFNTAALGAYNNGSGVTGTGAVAPLFHWTSKSNSLSLQDSRPSLVGGTANEDAATVWVVWDSATTGVSGTPNIWVYAKVDTVVGDRCFFANPACTVVDFANPTTFADWKAAGAQQLGTNLWGADTTIASAPNGAAVLSVLEGVVGTMTVNAVATDIRPEDAYFAIARANSALGANSYDAAHSDSLDGLGYNSSNASGTAVNESGTCVKQTTPAKLVGTPIMSAFQNTGITTDAANVLSFNLSGKDPFSCNTLAAYSVSNVGGEPIIFVHGQQNTLNGLTTATEAQLQQVFSGTNTDASAFGLSAGNINAYLREPTSGTMNTTEAVVFRYPTLYSSAGGTTGTGLSQETGVGTPTPGTTSNPLNNFQSGAGLGMRWRGIGTSEVVNSVQCSTDGAGSKCTGGNTANTNHTDGIAYTFFSYGNVAALSDNTKFAYIQLNGVDPIFTSFSSKIDPGQPAAANGAMPGATETTFPACENTIWQGKLSFPNVRNGSYRAWSILRMAYASSVATDVKDLITTSNKFAVIGVPDYIPVTAVAIAANGGCGSLKFEDPGFTLTRAHYQQRDGADAALGKAPVTSGTTEAGGDMGGAIVLNVTTAPATLTQVTQTENGASYTPALRPNN